MVFTTHFFLFYFLPITLGVYYLLPKRARALFLTLISYLFYGWANPKWIFLLLLSTAVDFACGLAIASGQETLSADGPRNRWRWLPAKPKLALIISLVTNLGLLALFKYFDFFASTLNQVHQLAGGQDPLLDFMHLALPVGISFYTFQSMSYTMDVYRRQAQALRNPIDFACYVALFPQLVAGPIVRYKDIADQIRQRSHTLQKFSTGIAWFCFGFAKKILVANPMGHIADTCFSAGSLETLDAWLGMVAYAFQIYFDFSGYSDMAIGLGLMLGFRFPKNFDSPYCSASITEFWRRWHISLSSWLRDYLYIPLGGNRKGERRTYINLAIVMLLGGLWHGASWNFVIWGGLHGMYLAGERFLGSQFPSHRIPRLLRVGITFFLVCLTWVFFRAHTLSDALAYLQALTGLLEAGPAAALVALPFNHGYYLGMMALAAMLVWFCPNTWNLTRNLTWPRQALGLLLFIIAIMAMWTQAANPFLYFQF